MVRKAPAYLPYLQTLRRIPGASILDMATRNIDMILPESCLCGWAVREALAVAARVDAGKIVRTSKSRLGTTTPELCAELYGGDAEEWQAIFYDTTFASASEMAFTLRVMECAK